MSIEREALKVRLEESKKAESSTTVVEEPAQELTLEQRRAKIATVLERGIVHDRLSVPLPDDVYGEWVRNDVTEISRMQALGFEVDYTHAAKRALHSDGNGAPVVGDVIFMTTSRQNKELIDSVLAERVHNIHNPKKPKEEKDYENQTNASTAGIIPTINESSTKSINRDELAAAIINK